MDQKEIIFNYINSILNNIDDDFDIYQRDQKFIQYNYKNQELTTNTIEMFCALSIKKNYVSFYYMPLYNNPLLKDKIPEPLLKYLKGKSCFNFNSFNKEILDHLSFFIKDTA